jgi:hypothetical protein
VKPYGCCARTVKEVNERMRRMVRTVLRVNICL